MKPTIHAVLRLAGLAFVFAALPAANSAAPSPYVEEENIRIPAGDGATVCANVLLPRGPSVRVPAALEFTIYADPQHDLQRMRYAVRRGYAAITAYTRGKACSSGPIVPYEDDGRDADAVIDWIARQHWSDGRVGMYGGSYNGFTQWAAVKHASPALKTIVPYVANNPGDGLPMQNNIFLPVNYAWIYYVTANRYLDDAIYNAPRWTTLNERWYASGRAYRAIDSVAGVPNPWLQKWLRHPGYDAYWQSMAPYRSEFARIQIPVLTVTGFYDDGQLSALGYFNDFNRFNARAKNYVVIGPWSHFGSQHSVKDAVLRGYRIDPVAQVDTPKLTFDWFDYVMRGKPRPELIAAPVNYEIMGANRWCHVPSLRSGETETLYLSAAREARGRLLSASDSAKRSALPQSVDFKDRKTMNNDSYPYLIVGKTPNVSNGYVFVSKPFARPADVSGFDADIDVVINKRDVDIGLVLYEEFPDGKLMQLSYATQRASYAWDKSRRRLLIPGRPTVVPIRETSFFSRRIAKGSRLMLTLNVNKNPFAEINYGTGRDVAGEDIHDAAVPLRVEWLTDSVIRIHRLTPSLCGAFSGRIGT